MMEFL